MVDAPLRLLACVLPATALSQGRGYGSTSAATKTIVSGLTQLVNLNGGAKPANKTPSYIRVRTRVHSTYRQ